MTKIIEQFEKDVQNGFEKCLTRLQINSSQKKLKVAAAVSGGADSTAMLTALFHILGKNAELIAVTVNHNLRPEEETTGDADFVENYCRSIGVKCIREDIERGKIISESKEDGTGIEAAARNARYNIFEKIIEKEKIDVFCLAHNKNDRAETLLMHFLQGSISGIPETRGKYIRPLLDIDRKHIEMYLAAQNIPFRTDSTNSDTAMLRNRMRNIIIPVLNEQIPGWQKSVFSLEEKNNDDEEILESLSEKAFAELNISENDIFFAQETFCCYPEAIRIRVLYKIISKLNLNGKRIPYRHIRQISAMASSEKSDFNFCADSIEVTCKNAVIHVQKKIMQATEKGFFVILKGSGNFAAGNRNIRAEKRETGIELRSEDVNGLEKTLVLLDACFPVAVRSVQSADTICASDGTERQVSRIFSGWKCTQCSAQIPVIQELSSPEQKNIALWGALEGYPDWIVKKE